VANIIIEKQELICITCPRGCLLTIGPGQEGKLEVEGNFCPKGREYAEQEIIDPRRVLTVLMRIEGSDRPVSVKTDKPVPKSMLFECADTI